MKFAEVTGTTLAPLNPDPDPSRKERTAVNPGSEKKSFDTHARPYAEQKQASARTAEHWALGDKYPLDTEEHVKTASAYFDEHAPSFSWEDRRTFAQNLTKRASALKVACSNAARAYASDVYAGPGKIASAIRSRRSFFTDADTEAISLLDKVAAAQKIVPPGVYIEMLGKFDEKYALHMEYGGAIPDPVASAVDVVKTASFAEMVGTVHVTESKLQNLATNHKDLLGKYLAVKTVEAFQKDPVGTYKGLPAHVRVIVSRLARSTEPGELLWSIARG